MTVKTVLITGGAGGIGREFTKLFAQDGYQIVVFSLLQNELDDLGTELAAKFPSVKYIPVQMDLSEVDSAERVFAWCQEHNLTIDVLVNNVGFGLLGEHVDIEDSRIEKMLLVNNLLLTKLCHAFGRQMKARGAGHILNVASLAAFSPVPLFTAYSATKAYVLAFSVGLSRELQDYGVTVSCLCPGTTKTAFLDTAQTKSKSASGATKFMMAYMVTPDVVASAGYRGLFNKKLIILPNWFLYLQAVFIRHMPINLVSWWVHLRAKK